MPKKACAQEIQTADPDKDEILAICTLCVTKIVERSSPKELLLFKESLQRFLTTGVSDAARANSLLKRLGRFFGDVSKSEQRKQDDQGTKDPNAKRKRKTPQELIEYWRDKISRLTQEIRKLRKKIREAEKMSTTRGAVPGTDGEGSSQDVRGAGHENLVYDARVDTSSYENTQTEGNEKSMDDSRDPDQDFFNRTDSEKVFPITSLQNLDEIPNSFDGPVSKNIMRGCHAVFETERMTVEPPLDTNDNAPIKTFLSENETKRYDVKVVVTEISISREKHIYSRDGFDEIRYGDTSDLGPAGMNVTYGFLSTIMHFAIGQNIPMNRVSEIVSSPGKQFVTADIHRYLEFIARKFVDIYLSMGRSFSDCGKISLDDTVKRTLEVKRFNPNASKNKNPPWHSYSTCAEAKKRIDEIEKINDELKRKSRAINGPLVSPKLKKVPLKYIVNAEIPLVAEKVDGSGPMQQYVTTVLHGQTVDNDPKSYVIFFRSHFGHAGSLLDGVLAPSTLPADTKPVKILICDLSRNNLIRKKELLTSYEFKISGCLAHSRRAFVTLEDDVPLEVQELLLHFDMIFTYEKIYIQAGKRPEHQKSWRAEAFPVFMEEILKLCEKLSCRYSNKHKIGEAAFYFKKNYNALMMPSIHPHLPLTNNYTECLLRSENLLQNSSMFRGTIEGRTILDILRTIFQTCLASGTDFHEYLKFVAKQTNATIKKSPSEFTPYAFLKAQKCSNSS